jgi:hypothetical protein
VLDTNEPMPAAGALAARYRPSARHIDTAVGSEFSPSWTVAHAAVRAAARRRGTGVPPVHPPIAGSRIRVYWPTARKWFKGTVDANAVQDGSEPTRRCVGAGALNHLCRMIRTRIR